MSVGRERSGRTAAVLAGLLSTCRRHEIVPQRYLTQLLTNPPGTPMSRLDQWLSDKWKYISGTLVPADLCFNNRSQGNQARRHQLPSKRISRQ